MTTMTDEELTLLRQLPDVLHSGEAASLCIAKKRKWRFLSDDLAARKQAQRWNIPVSGSAGLLLFAVNTKRISLEQGNVFLGLMIRKAHYRSPVTDLNDLLRLAV